MKSKEIRDLSNTDLNVRKRELKEELFHLRIQQASGQIEKTSLLRSLRKEVARIETVLSERRNAAAKDAQKQPAAQKQAA
jgi:large subunit ribosomal protein L29